MKIRKEINYYNMLGLHPDVDSTHENYESIRIKYLKDLTDKDIKTAYRNLSKKFHPDKNGGDDTKFKEIAEAYKVLSNKEYREEYDTLSKHGMSYDILTELYEFEFSNDTVSTDSFRSDVDKFKKKELINILVEIDEFRPVIEYERYISCNHCDGTGVNPALVDMFDCEMCDGEGVDRFGKKCLFCNGKGKASLGFEKCPKCKGERIIPIRDKVKIKEKDFKENKLILKFKGNASKVDQGKVGNLYIKIKD
jgi:DnaJ-class molecular chaperone